MASSVLVVAGQAHARLVPLYETDEECFSLPAEGFVTIGRRRECNIVVQDLAVSGTHCFLRCSSEPLSFEVEDNSTNGTFVNGMPLGKGSRSWLADGDLLALTRTEVPAPGTSAAPSIQFRLDVRSSASSCFERPPAPTPAQTPRLPGPKPPRSPLAPAAEAENAPAEKVGGTPALGGADAAKATKGGSSGSTSVPRAAAKAPPRVGLTQDLLLHEQQSKALVTTQLIGTRRRLDEERSRTEALRRELRSTRAALESERARRVAAQEKCEQFQVDTQALCVDKQQLNTLREEHALLRTRLETSEVELGNRQRTAASLEAEQERLQAEIAHMAAEQQRAEAQQADVQQKLQQAQERAEALAEQHGKETRQAEEARAEAKRLQGELNVEQAAREKLEDQRSSLAAEAERALCGEKAARDALSAACAQREELEARVSANLDEAEGALFAAQQSQQEYAEEADQVEHLRGAAAQMTDVMYAYMGAWAGIMQASARGSARSLAGPPPQFYPAPLESMPLAQAAAHASVEETLVRPTQPTVFVPTVPTEPPPVFMPMVSMVPTERDVAPTVLTPTPTASKTSTATTPASRQEPIQPPASPATPVKQATLAAGPGPSASVAEAEMVARGGAGSPRDVAGAAGKNVAGKASDDSPAPPLASPLRRKMTSSEKLLPPGPIGFAGNPTQRSPTLSVLALPGQPAMKRPRLSHAMAR